MKKRCHKTKIVYLSILITGISGCSPEPSDIYIDIKGQAIIDCKGLPFKELVIENDSDFITMEGAASPILFNKKTRVSKVTVKDNVFYGDYTLRLKPESNYQIYSSNGYDRGPLFLTFTTDSAGKVYKASIVDCN